VDGDAAAVEHINAWFKTLEQRFRSLMEDEGLALEYDRSAFNFSFRKSDGYVFDLNTLADGHATVMAILAELLLRVDTARRARKDMTFDPEGIVIIDEIETHLHLSLQEQILPLLTEMFPRFQFIVATHSPAVIASIPGAIVYDFAKKSQAPSEGYRGVPYGALMTGHFGISSEIDLDSTEKLLALRKLADVLARTTEQESELQVLSALLSARSRALAVEVWMVKERLGESSVRLAGDEA
jgi:AAA domain, putative AbiEii toxin, Type IV TA system